MSAFPGQGGSRNTWGTELINFFSPFFDLVTGLFKSNVIPGAAIQNASVTDTQLATPTAGKVVTNGNTHDHVGGDGAQIDHTGLVNIGTNTHAQVDTFIASKAAASGLASLNSSSKVVQDPANLYPTTQNIVAASRALGTVYQNTTGRPMFVATGLQSTTAATFFAYTDSSNPPTTIVTHFGQGNATYGAPVCFWVLPGNYYKITCNAGTPTVVEWTEWY